MLWFMCLPLSSLVPGVQCVGLLFMPFLASLSGPDAVLRFSLILLFHSFLFGLLPSVVKKIPFMETIFFMALVAVPLTSIPSSIIWVYNKIIWTSEPVLMVLEALSVVSLTTTISKGTVEHIDEHPLLVKSLIIGASMLSYSCTCVLWILSYLSGGTSVKWLLLIMLVVIISMTVTTINQDKGIILDSAALSLYLLWCVWFMQQENKLAAHPLKAPPQWSRLRDSSLIQLVINFTTVQFDSLTASLNFLLKLFSPISIIMILVRTLVLSYGVILTKQLTDRGDEDDEGFYDSDDEDENTSLLSSHGEKTSFAAIPFQLAFIFVVTQIIVYNIDTVVNPDDFESFLFLSKINLYFEELRTLRLLQCGICVAFYFWNLWKEEEVDYF